MTEVTREDLVKYIVEIAGKNSSYDIRQSVTENHNYDSRIWRTRDENAWKQYENMATLYSFHNTGGSSGGNCWGDEASPYYTTDDDISGEVFLLIFENFCPNLSFLGFRKFEREMMRKGDSTEYEYYGNRSTYNYRYVKIDELLTFINDNR